MRDDVARSKHASFCQTILDKINTVTYCNRKDFKTRKRYFRKRRRSWELIQQTILYPEHSEFVKMKFTEKQAAMFEEKMIRVRHRKGLVKVFVFKEEWRFVLQVRQNIVTHVRMVDVELEIREKEIDNYLEKANQYNKLNRLLGHSIGKWRRWDWLPKPQHRFQKQSLREILETVERDFVLPVSLLK